MCCKSDKKSSNNDGKKKKRVKSLSHKKRLNEDAEFIADIIMTKSKYKNKKGYTFDFANNSNLSYSISKYVKYLNLNYHDKSCLFTSLKKLIRSVHRVIAFKTSKNACYKHKYYKNKKYFDGSSRRVIFVQRER